jgi:hypothetical protein
MGVGDLRGEAGGLPVSVLAYSRFPETKVCGSALAVSQLASRLSIASSRRASAEHWLKKAAAEWTAAKTDRP